MAGDGEMRGGGGGLRKKRKERETKLVRAESREASTEFDSTV